MDLCPTCGGRVGFRVSPQRRREVNAPWTWAKATGIADRVPEWRPDRGSRGPLVVVGRYADALKVAAKGGK